VIKEFSIDEPVDLFISLDSSDIDRLALERNY